jgi:FKBP-type peptidyl-prolyl cis-trans isomerase (trigger factor)
MPLSIGSLQRRRAQLAKNLNKEHAAAERHLAAFVSARNRATELDTKMALLDRELNGLMDAKLSHVSEVQIQSGEYEDPM